LEDAIIGLGTVTDGWIVVDQMKFETERWKNR